MKQRIKKCVTDLLKDESGQGTTEYILMLVAVVALALAFGPTFKDKVGSLTDDISGKIDNFTGSFTSSP